MADAPVDRPDWVQCIELAHGRSWCGQRITGFFFAGLDHAAQSAAMGGRLTACQRCVDAAMKALRAGGVAARQQPSGCCNWKHRDDCPYWRGAGSIKPYGDSTTGLHVGDSSFESWFADYLPPADRGDKQKARDAYAAGMGDPLVIAREAAAVAAQSAISAEQIERHALTAKQCPPDTEVLLASSVRKLLGIGPATDTKGAAS